MVAKEKTSEARTGTAPAHEVVEQRYGPLDYLIVNVVFIAFCCLQFVVIKAITGEQIGLFFFFGAIIIGFVLVSAFTYVFDVVAEETEPESPPPDQRV